MSLKSDLRACYHSLPLHEARNLPGHVHAYERSAPVNNFTVDPCGAVHITIGDAGNSEGLSFLTRGAERKLRAPPASSPYFAQLVRFRQSRRA